MNVPASTVLKFLMSRHGVRRRSGILLLCCMLFAELAPARAPQAALPDSSMTIPAQVDSLGSDHRPLRWHSMVTNIPSDYVAFYHTAFQAQHIPLYVFMIGATAAFLVSDERTWQSSNQWYHSSPTVGSVSNFIVSLGDGKTQFGLGAAFALKGWISDDQHALRTGSQIIEAVLASGSLVQVLKHITGRESPFTESRAGGAWRFFPNQIEYHKHVPAYDAYPSGHLTTSIATVVVIAENYPDTKWIRPVGYGLSGLLAISMVNRGIHWYSDYPLAVAIGYWFGMVIAHPEGTTSPGPELGFIQHPTGFGSPPLNQIQLTWHL